MPKRISVVRLTLDQASSEFAIDRRSLSRRLSAINAKPEDGKYSILQCHRAVTGDLDAERLRKTKEEADKIELENEKTRGTLIEIESVYKHFEGVFVSFRARVLASNLEDQEKDEILKDLMKLKARDVGKLNE